jgi:hypothetical protein
VPQHAVGRAVQATSKQAATSQLRSRPSTPSVGCVVRRNGAASLYYAPLNAVPAAGRPKRSVKTALPFSSRCDSCVSGRARARMSSAPAQCGAHKACGHLLVGTHQTDLKPQQQSGVHVLRHVTQGTPRVRRDSNWWCSCHAVLVQRAHEHAMEADTPDVDVTRAAAAATAGKRT